RPLFRRSDRPDPPGAIAAFGPPVPHPVGRLDDVQVVFDDQHRIAAVDELVHDLQQHFDVAEMQARGGLVQDVQRAPRTAAREFQRRLYALRLAARQGGGARAQAYVRQAHVGQWGRLARGGRPRFELFERLCHREPEYFADIAAAITDFEGFAVVAFAVAYVAGHVHVGQEMHLDLDHAVALAGFAPAALDVEAEAAGVVAARARLGYAGEQFAYGREQARVGGRVAAGGAADGALVDTDDLVE